MEHLFSVWPKVLEQIQKSKHVLLLSDFDGTLTPIVEKPELAKIPEDVRRLLKILISQRHVNVGIISGRALVDLKEKVQISGLIYAGNHGFEIEAPGWSFVSPIADEIKPFFRIVRQILSLALGSVKGSVLEDKGITLSVHYRGVEEDQTQKVREIVEKATMGPVAKGIFKVTTGKKVYEVRPAVAWDKGKAVRLLMKKFGKGGRQSGLLPIYLGDDLTDEDGFRMIEKYGYGISIFVGETKAQSAAQYFLKSPDEVYQFLDKLVDNSQRGLLCEQYSIT